MALFPGGLIILLVVCMVLAVGFVSYTTVATVEPLEKQTERAPLEMQPITEYPAGTYEEGSLIGIVESEAHAQEIAALYGITVVTVNDNFALFHTQEDVMAVIERGRQNGWPLLEPNLFMSLLE